MPLRPQRERELIGREVLLPDARIAVNSNRPRRAYDWGMADERVRIWRPTDEPRILLMAGQTTRYAIEPRAEFVFGLVAGRSMRARRGRETYVVHPGQLVAWDPSSPHAGTAVGDSPWTSRLMVVEVADLGHLAADQEAELCAEVEFPNPVVSDPELAAGFVRLHLALEHASTRLERDERLAQWLHTLIGRAAPDHAPRRVLGSRDDAALRRAFEHLAGQPERNTGLDELAAVAGIGKFRLVRLFRERTGLPPHALQIAHRVRAARRLLEAGESVAATAAATGFADQSHLHRHFRRTLGLTPGEYQRRLL
jgi:AraC-like DNA-binding protein